MNENGVIYGVVCQKILKSVGICVLELKEEVVYYDVCEDAEELQSAIDPGQPADSPAARQLKGRLRNLEMKRGNICARRAYLRNKKVRGRGPASARCRPLPLRL